MPGLGEQVKGTIVSTIRGTGEIANAVTETVSGTLTAALRAPRKPAAKPSMPSGPPFATSSRRRPMSAATSDRRRMKRWLEWSKARSASA